MKCPLCERELGSENIDRHHLIPKSKGGKDQYEIHLACHRQIHMLFSEKELKNKYSTWTKLKAAPEMQKFIEWIKTKPLEFVPRHKQSRR